MIETIILRGIRCVVIQCGECGIPYTVPYVVYDTHYQEGGFHYCPNGHGWGWTKDGSESSRIRRERDRLAQQIAERDDEIELLRNECQAAENRAAREARARIRIKARTRNGVCPDCNRTFQNLRRHIVTKHGPKCEVVQLTRNTAHNG